MKELKFIKDYRDHASLRKSFFELANSVFGIDFKKWYESGFWGGSYIPFSYVDEGRVVANVSLNVLDLLVDGKQHTALQIGTVMTEPHYRNRGLSKSLLNRVLEEYKNKCDFIYLFANQSVLDFYPKFGFNKVEEFQYTTDFSSDQKVKNKLYKLDSEKIADLHFIYEFAKERVPVSQRFATLNSQGIFMYYCLNVFCDNLYYLDSEDAIVIFNKAENQIDIFDIISKNEMNINRILNTIVGKGRKKIVFHYTPDYEGMIFERNPIQCDDTLFVLTNGNYIFPERVKHPITSIA
ncbi:GNAT family N-acetyltransferase [Bacillus niameyensis]|uniref:GNAT family N-acetyltransferase n=1 Tax=Bacillus niameyensis TaxID=1522308 RepID=UPI000784C5D1|nr:GNAT family N-acetyltransferase [Bacillus niameyensis]